MLGLGDRNLKMIREALGVRITARGESVRVSGEHEAVAAAHGVLDRLAAAADRNEHLTRQQVLDLIGLASAGKMKPKAGWRTARDGQRHGGSDEAAGWD